MTSPATAGPPLPMCTERRVGYRKRYTKRLLLNRRRTYGAPDPGVRQHHAPPSKGPHGRHVPGSRLR